MQKEHGKAIWGLNLATLIISALMAVCCLMGIVGIAIGGTYINDHPEEVFKSTHDSSHHFDWSLSSDTSIEAAMPSFDVAKDLDYYVNNMPLSTSDALDFANMGLAIGTAACAVGIVLYIFTLIVGIIGIRNARKPEKLGLVFGMSIAGAIVSFFSGSVVVMVLLIISAVFASKDKKFYAAGGVPGGTIPVAGVPVQPAPPAPTAQPVNLTQPATPVSPAPVESEAPVVVEEVVVVEETVTTENPVEKSEN